MITVRQSHELLHFLETHEVDGATVSAALFEGGRLCYPGRKELEYELGLPEPYTLQHEARVIEGMGFRWNGAVRFLARIASQRHTDDPTLHLLWEAHRTYSYRGDRVSEPAIDRLIAAMVTVHECMTPKLVRPELTDSLVIESCIIVMKGLQAAGFPPDSHAFEELFDGAPPACVGLNIIDIDGMV